MQERKPCSEAADFIENYVRAQLAALGCRL